MFGFELLSNFKFPYFSRDIAEFWRRWHISLSSWFRDYLYIPLGGSRNGKYKAVRNTFIIFLVSGFWHGASWNFIAWGFIHACGFLPLLLLNRNRRYTTDIVAQGKTLPSLKELIQMLSTFAFVTIAWVFFRAETTRDALSYLTRIIHYYSNSENLLGNPKAKYALLYIFPLIFGDWLLKSNERILLFTSQGFINRLIGYILLIILFKFSISSGSTFIYFNF